MSNKYSKKHSNESHTSYQCDEESESIIDLSTYSISEACNWLLHSLNLLAFIDTPYAIPYSNYVLSWHRSVPLQAILILQSPYPRNIFPHTAAAMSYDTELCKKMMEGREMPPTIQVLTNDLYINGGMDKADSIAILKNGWALVDKGILLVNEAVFHTFDRQESYIESAKQCSVIIRLLQETEKYGKRTVEIFAFGEVGEKVGSNLCSWYKSSTVRLTKRKVTHPAGVARRFFDLDSPDCHMNTPSFSKSLVKCLRNHVAFMHTMSKKSELEIKYQQQQDLLQSFYTHFPTIVTSLESFKEVNGEVMSLDKFNDEEKALFAKLGGVTDDLITRFRIASSILINAQTRGGTISGSVSRSAPSMRSQAPSASALSQHTGQELTTAPAIVTSTSVKVKPIKRKSMLSGDVSSFSEVTSPPSIASLDTAVSTTAPSVSTPSKLKVKPIKSKLTPSSTPQKKVTSMTDSVQSTPSSYKDAAPEQEEADTLSPLVNKFKNKMKIPQPKSKDVGTTKQIPKPKTSTSKTLSKEQINALSCVEAVVETCKGDDLDDDDAQYFNDIQNDIQCKTIYNSIVERLVISINKDIEEIPDFNFIDWVTDQSKPSATFETCKEEFGF